MGGNKREGDGREEEGREGKGEGRGEKGIGGSPCSSDFPPDVGVLE